MSDRPAEPDPLGGSPPAGRVISYGSLLVLSLVALFLGFYRNQWHAARDKKFKEFQLDSESLVIARMVESRQRGILSQNGLLGWGDVNPLDLNQSDYTHQYDVFLAGTGFRTYSLYKSASGAQALIFSAAQQLSPFPPAIDLRNFRALVALLLAASLSGFLMWVFREFGAIVALFALATTIVSQWITVFGRNLFYFIWASFLPLAVMAWYLAARQRRRKVPDLGLASVAFGSILFKCLMNGYDFIIPALSMPVIPFVYYALLDRWPGKLLARRSALLFAGIFAAVVVSIVLLAAQLRVSEGSFGGGLAYILQTFSRRTYADPALFPTYAESLQASPWSVIWTYIAYDTAIGILGLRFLDVLIGFASVTVAYLVVRRLAPAKLRPDRKADALIFTTWLSLLSPLSWFFLFKGQAYVHTHTNYLAWHMPFTLFGYVMCAALLQSIGQAYFPKRPAIPRSDPTPEM